MKDLRELIAEIMEKIIEANDTDLSSVDRYRAWSNAVSALNRLKAEIAQGKEQERE